MIASRVAQRYLAATGAVRIVVDVPATLNARRKYLNFEAIVIARFDQSVSLYRIFDEQEMQHIVRSGRITGGTYAAKPERDHGASWATNVSAVIEWGNRVRGKRLGEKLYLAKIDALDKRFAHLDPEVSFDPFGPDEQIAMMRADRCNLGLGCSVIDVVAADADFFEVDVHGQMHRLKLSEVSIVPEATGGKVTSPLNKTPRDDLGLRPGDMLKITKGSVGLGVAIRSTTKVMAVWQVQGENVVFVKLHFYYPRKFRDGTWVRDPLVLYATHPNRLGDLEVALLSSKGDRILARKK
jgi:hypothetical protein